jgi:hypothetical protein
MTTNYMKFPIFSWRPVIVGTVDYDDGVASGTIDLATDIGSSYWGVSVGASAAANSDSIQGRLAALLVAKIGSGSIAVTYTWPDGEQGPMRTSYARTGTNVSLTFSTTAVAAQFGFNATAVTFTNVTAKVADFQDAGAWAPHQRAGQDERWDFNDNVGVTETIDGSSRKLRTWGENLTRRSFRFPAVYVANIRADAAAETTYAAAAERVVADTNNTLQGMLDRARLPESTDNAPAFRVYTDEAEYRVCYLLDGLRDLEALCESQSARRLWAVSFTMRDDG